MLSLIAARELRHGGIPPALCVVVRKREDALYLPFSDSFIVGTGDRFKNVRIDLIPQEIDSMFALADEEEFEVVKSLAAFPETVVEAAEKYEPSYIARYAVDLAQKFNKFYFDCKILTAEEGVKQFRLALTGAVLRTLKNALGLLGIGVPDKM